jgi:hypothetical protein
MEDELIRPAGRSASARSGGAGSGLIANTFARD